MRSRRARLCAALCLLASVAAADVTRPAYLGLTETRPGRFDVVWRVPRRGDRVLAIAVRLPEVFREVASPAVDLAPGGQTTRWTVQAEPWALQDQAIVIEGPGAARVETMIRFQFRDGSVVTRVLPPGSSTCRFPRREPELGAAQILQGATRAGLWHVLSSGAHLLLLFGVALWGRARRPVAIALALFLGGQLAGIVLRVPLPGPPSHALLGVAGAIGAWAALRPGRPRLHGVAAVCGFFGGTALAAGDRGGLLPLFGVAAGIDAASLVIAFSAVGILRPRVRTAACYLVGTAGIAVALADASAPRPSSPREAETSILVAPVGPRQAAPVSAPIAPRSDSPLQLFLDIGPFETRVEWVARVSALGVANGEEIGVPEQEATKEAVGALFDRHVAVRIDGRAAVAAEKRVDFVTREPRGILERLAPVVERTAEAMVGIVHSFPTREPPGRVVVRWEPLPGVKSVPATIVDPERIRSVTLTPAIPELAWSDSLSIPPIRRIAVRDPVLEVSLLALGLLAAGLWAATRFAGRGGVSAARVLLAGAFLVAPYAQVSLPLPETAAPSTERTAAVVEALLTNVYRALEQSDENTAYDRLGVSVTGSSLSRVFLEQRRMLELGRRGGARVRVDSVEVVESGEPQVIDDGRLRVEAAWEVGGFVVHFGHRHFRQSRYEAELELVARDGGWKINRLEILGKERTR